MSRRSRSVEAGVEQNSVARAPRPPTRTALVRVLAAGAAAAALLAGCSALVGYEIPATTSVTTAGGTGGGGAAAGGGTGGSPSGGSAGMGGTGDGGTAGGTTTSCEPLDVDACGNGAKCSVVDLVTGRTGCIAAGLGAAWTSCSVDQDCVAGAFCDLATLLCRPVCQTVAHCSVGARCLPAEDSNGAAIPFLGLCTAHCDPLVAAPCGDGLNCVYLGNPPEFDCARSEGASAGSDCSLATDCAAGLTCVDDRCRAWCPPSEVGSICVSNGANWQCTATVPATAYSGEEYGVCVP